MGVGALARYAAAGALLGLVVAGPAQAAAPRTGRVVVTLAPAPAAAGPVQARAAAVAGAAGARLTGDAIPQLRAIAVRPRPGETVDALRARLLRDPRVAQADVEHRARPRFEPNDPALTRQETGTDQTVEWWAAKTFLPQAWDLQRGEGARVAVIDTGVDRSHPELHDQIDEAKNFSGQGTADEDPEGHGTHVASLACGEGDNGVGLAGAGLSCHLLVARTDFTDASVAAAITWATDRGADAIVMSFGTDPGTTPSHVVTAALEYAYAHGVVLAAAAADQAIEDQGYPANVLQPTGTGPSLGVGKGLSVTAANVDDQRASFAGHGTQISLASYGAFGRPVGPAGIFGAFPGPPDGIPSQGLSCLCQRAFDGDVRYAYLQGTSMATPIVAAVGALVRRMNPDLGIADVLRVLKSSARRPSGQWTGDLGWGILDAAAALRAAAAMDRRAPASRLRASARRTRSRFVLLRWTGSDETGPPGVRVSGIARYEVWRSIDRGRRRRLKTLPARTRRLRTGLRAGHRYAFSTIAVDVAGNREPLPARADARVDALRSR